MPKALASGRCLIAGAAGLSSQRPAPTAEAPVRPPAQPRPASRTPPGHRAGRLRQHGLVEQDLREVVEIRPSSPAMRLTNACSALTSRWPAGDKFRLPRLGAAAPGGRSCRHPDHDAGGTNRRWSPARPGAVLQRGLELPAGLERLGGLSSACFLGPVPQLSAQIHRALGPRLPQRFCPRTRGSRAATPSTRSAEQHPMPFLREDLELRADLRRPACRR